MQIDVRHNMGGWELYDCVHVGNCLAVDWETGNCELGAWQAGNRVLGAWEAGNCALGA